MTKHDVVEFVSKNKDTIIAVLLEHGMGKTRHGSMIGFVFNLFAGMIDLIRKIRTKNKEKNS